MNHKHTSGLDESSPLLSSSLVTSHASSSPFSLEIEPAPEPNSPAVIPSAEETRSTIGNSMQAIKSRVWHAKLMRNQTTVAIIIACLVLLVLLLLIFFSLGSRRSPSSDSSGQTTPVPSLPDPDLDYFSNGLGYQDDWQGRLTILPSTANAAAARAEWVLGMRLYHCMWYPLSTLHFKRARSIAPHFPMAYWGEAMSYKQPLWGTEDLESAMLVLSQLANVYSVAQKSVVDPSTGSFVSRVTEEEAGYLGQVFAYFNGSQSMQARELMQLNSMAKIYSSHANSSDACSLYGLSILASSYYQGLTNTTPSSGNLGNDAAAAVSPTEVSSRSIMEACLPTWPNHTGLLHYLVHAYDVSNVTLAQRGLQYGYKLAQVAPLSAHTTHMVSHLSVRMGNWAEVIAYNNLSLAAGDVYCSRQSEEDGEGDYCSYDNRYHSLDWLAFGLAQTCRFSSLPPLLSRAQEVATSLKYPYFSTWAYKVYSYSSILSNLWFTPSSTSLTLPPAAGGSGVIGVIGVWPDPYSPGFLTLKDPLGSGSLPSPLPPQIISSSVPDTDDYYLAVGECFALIALAYKYSMSLSPSIVKAIASKQQVSQSASSPLLLADAQRVGAELDAVGSRLLAIQSAVTLRNTSSYLSVYARQLVLMVKAMKSFHNDCLQVLPFAAGNISTASSLLSPCLNSSSIGRGGWRDAIEQAVALDPLLNPDAAPSLIPIHADELYGQLLLLLQSVNATATTADAARASSLFSKCLSLYPNRMPCVLGLARSNVALSDTINAKVQYNRLINQCALGDPLWPGLVEARDYLARHPS